MRAWIGAGLIVGAGLSAGLAWGHETAAALSGPATLMAHDLVRYLHIVLLVFWLGPDVAITIAGSYAANTQLSASQRAGAARMAEYYAIMPKVCMSLMLTVGGILSEYVGLEHPWWQMAGIVLVGPLWLSLTLLAWFGSGGAGLAASRLERWLRIALVFGIPVSVGYSTITGRLAEAPYVGSKLLLFAAVLVLGLLASRAYAPFLAAVRALRPDAPAPELEQTIANGFRRGRLFVFATWAALLLAALIGVVKPGVAEDQKAPAVNGSTEMEMDAAP